VQWEGRRGFTDNKSHRGRLQGDIIRSWHGMEWMHLGKLNRYSDPIWAGWSRLHSLQCTSSSARPPDRLCGPFSLYQVPEALSPRVKRRNRVRRQHYSYNYGLDDLCVGLDKKFVLSPQSLDWLCDPLSPRYDEYCGLSQGQSEQAMKVT
jgi:hypothetical protein